MTNITSQRTEISVVIAIPTLNEAKTIETVVTALALERKDVPNLTIVIADGGSADETVEIAQRLAMEKPFIRVIENPKRIQSAAVNAVAYAYSGLADIIVRCDAHSIYPQGYIARLINTLQALHADSVVVPMDSIGRNCVEKAVAWISDSRVGSGGSAHRGGNQSGFVDHGHHAAFRLPRFLEVGGYDETFTHNEDAEFDCRLRAIGGRIYLDACNRISYYPRSRLSALWRQYFNYGRGRSRTVRRHPGSARLRQMAVPVHILLSLLSIAAAVTTGNILLLAWPVLYVGVLVAASVMIAIRRHSACGLMAGPAAFVMHSAWGLGFLSGVLFKRERAWSPLSKSAIGGIGT